MKLQITEPARHFIDQRGGAVTIDFITATGWGKVAEVSVDTHTKGRNLTAYRTVRDPDLKVYVSPVLYGMISRLQIDLKGRFVKKLAVELAGVDGGGDPSAGGANCC